MRRLNCFRGVSIRADKAVDDEVAEGCVGQLDRSEVRAF
jgi:hypothetical protein